MVLQVSVRLQLHDNALNCTFRDSNFIRQVPYAFRRVFGKAQKNVRMIR